MVEPNAALLIVDGDNLAHRAYHSSPKSMAGTGGFPINAIDGFFRRVSVLWQRERPRAVFVAWDSLGHPTYRDELWPTYQGGRIIDASIRQQLDAFPHLCEAFGFGVGKKPGYEADDILASAALEEVRNGGTCLLFTNDRDSFQLVNDSIAILSPKKGGFDTERFGPHEVVERFGVLPEQIPAFKALSGDSSDNIPGIKGVGPRTASSLLLQHGSLEGVLAFWDRPELTGLANMFYKICTMQTDFPVTLPPTGVPDWAGGAEALRILGAESVAKSMMKLASSSE